MGAHPDLKDEQRHVDRAYECLDAMRAHTEQLLEADHGPDEVAAQVIEFELKTRLRSLNDDAGPLCFGRIDEDAGDRYYIGRRHIKDAADEPVVVDWRAPVASPFYRATIRDSLGLRRRRRFIFEARRLTDIFEEDFADPDSIAAGHGGVPDPLLAELGRARTGEMRDIVATIQSEQDQIIRFPADRLVVVQGGPGTGKTAVGLHRAAFLLYEHRHRLEREGVLVVGPNDTFLHYIAGVLPSLGETAVRETTLETLFGARFSVTASDPDSTRALKGDIRMAEVVRRACQAGVNSPTDDVAIPLGPRVVRLDARRVRDALTKTLSAARTLASGREVFTDRLERLAYRAWTRMHHGAVDEEEFLGRLRRSSEFKRARNDIWPVLNPAVVVGRLLSRPSFLDECSAGILGPEQRPNLLGRKRSSRGPWSREDLPLLDEADAIISGPSFLYGHVIVDEAQDLSPMELRMLGRRSTTGGMTVLGDLAQATGIASQSRWDDAIVNVGAPVEARFFELTIGYRVPRAILDFANRLLPYAAPRVTTTRSIREEGSPPRVQATSRGAAGNDAFDEAVALGKSWPTVGVIVPENRFDEFRRSFARRDTSQTQWHTGDVATGITLLPATAAKGLEFDAVVVVEPGAIVAEHPRGDRMLYIALTRAVQELVLVHEDPLPPALELPQTA